MLFAQGRSDPCPESLGEHNTQDLRGKPEEDELSKYLATLLHMHTGQTSSYIKDSGHFISKISTLKLNPGDRLISFDVVSLFTKVPIKDTLTLIQQIFPEDIKAPFATLPNC